MASRWTTGVLTVLLIGTGAWGYRQYQDKQALMIGTENQYQQSFHSLASNVDLLQDELGKSLTLGTDPKASPTFANAWRIAYSAQSDLAQLPLMGMHLNKTQDFLQNVGRYSYEVSLHPTAQSTGKLTESEWNALHALYTQSCDVEQDLRTLQNHVMTQNLRFTDAQRVLAERKDKADNQILDGFKTLEKRVSQYPEIHSETLDSLKTRNAYDTTEVSGTNKTASEVSGIVAQFLNRNSTDGIQVMKNGSGARYPSYTVSVSNPNGPTTYLGVMEKGGHIVWMTQDKSVPNERLDLEQAQQVASKWVESHGYTGMSAIKADQFDHQAVYQFACQRGDMTFYPCSLTVRVALNDGSVTGFNGQDYVFYHKNHQVSGVKLTKAQAVAKINPHVEVQDVHPAQILDDNGKAVSVWEVLGTLDNNTYKVYINAATGVEERVEKLKQEAIGPADNSSIQKGVAAQKTQS